ncbi:homeobox protein rough [Caerostris extrusa]|uniref:Homeobox protein rough n=1 Tax=Caerostris extrusa TaxID=172846 RepID=A0AAV4M8V0_CAEEX|nr:homeobox protein rough [Caerostris extrusa]
MLPFAKFADLAAKSSAESSGLLASRSSVVSGSSTDGASAAADSFPPVFRPMFPPGGLFPGADTALIYRGLGEFPLAPTGLPAFCKFYPFFLINILRKWKQKLITTIILLG